MDAERKSQSDLGMRIGGNWGKRELNKGGRGKEKEKKGWDIPSLSKFAFSFFQCPTPQCDLCPTA